MSARQLALLLAVAAGAFVLALTLGRATRPSSAVAVPAAPAAEKVSMSGAGQAVAIPALKEPGRSVPAGAGGAGAGGAGQRPAQAVTARPRPSPGPNPAQKPPTASPGGGGDVTVSG